MPNPGKKTSPAEPFPFAYQRVRDPETGEYSWKRLVSPQIPDSIIATGNLDILQAFYETHKDTLTKADIKYMKAKLHTAIKADQLERKALQMIHDGEEYPKPEVTTKKGYTGLDSIRLDSPQTSNNGCWACGMSLLLKSRGVSMSQEEIRAFRPDFQPGEEQQMGEDQRLLMDSDSTNYLYNKADLLQKVLPNTAVTQVRLKPLPDQFVVQGGNIFPKPLSNDVYAMEPAQAQRVIDQYEADLRMAKGKVRKLFNEQARKQMGDIIRKALTEDMSPLVLNTGGNHYVTITGISANGKKIRVEDSFRSQDNTTQYMSIDDLIEKNLGPEGNGMTLTWLKDLPAPQHVPAPPKEGDAPVEVPRDDLDQLDLFDGNPGGVKAEQVDGEILIKLSDVENTNIIASSKTHMELGQVHGQEISNSVSLDQTTISQKLGGGVLKNDVVHLDREEATVYLGEQQYYYPKKLYAVGDPAISRENVLDASLKEKRNLIRDMNQELRRKPSDPKEMTKGSFGEAIEEQKHDLYFQAEDTAYHISRLYATLTVMKGKQAEGLNPSEMLMSNEDKQRIFELTYLATPSVKALLTKPDGKIKLPLAAVDDDPSKLLNAVNSFKDQRMDAVNKDAEEHTVVIDQVAKAMSDTGTGKNYFGIKRNANKDGYTQMMEALAIYKGKKAEGTATGLEVFRLTEKGVAYVSDKKTVRNTTTGKIRFDNTMRMLQQIMPAQEFQKLCNSINRARGVAGNPADPDYVSVKRYAPQTAEAIAFQKNEVLSVSSKSDAAKHLSTVLAARQIAQERDPQKSSKALVIRPDHEKEDQKALSRRASQIQKDPAFRSLMRTLSDKPATRSTQITQLCSEGGKRLADSVNAMRNRSAQVSSAVPSV